MKSKRLIPIVMATTLLGASAFISVRAIQHIKEENVHAAFAEGEELDLTTVPFYNTPQAGWGSVNVNQSCDGQALVVNGVTYAKGIGTHAFNDAASTDGDIEYDISTFSTQYEFFEAKVAFVNAGDNCFKFTVLVDDVVKDFIYVRKGTSWGDDNPYYLRCKITGGNKLTLRTQCTNWGYANGSCAWLEPKLFNVPEERVFASDILDRYNNTNGIGWPYLTGEAGLEYYYPMLDERVNGTQFSALTPWGVPVEYKKGLGTQLKNVNYDAYEVDKTNQNAFAGMTFDISGRGFTHFNTMAIMGAGSGAYLDAWADGVEIYHSPLFDASNAGLPISIAIPANTNSFELRVIAASGFADGLVDLPGACFFKGNEYLYTQPAAQTLAPEAAFPETHGFGQVGKALSVYDSSLEQMVESPRGLFIHKNETYTFGAPAATYDRLSGSIGCYGPETGHGSNNLKATFTYSDSSTVVYRSETFSRLSSNIPFAFDYEPSGLVSILLELEGDLACSASVIHNAKFEQVRPALSSDLESLFAILQLHKWQGAAARETGNCEADFYSARTIVLALSADDLDLFQNSTNEYIAAGRARYEAWALSLGEQAYANAKLSSNMMAIKVNSPVTMIIIISSVTVTLSLVAFVILRKKRRA